jgi:hypothetical protein
MFSSLNNLLSTLFLNTLNLSSSRSRRDKVTYPYTARGKIIVAIYVDIYGIRQEPAFIFEFLGSFGADYENYSLLGYLVEAVGTSETSAIFYQTVTHRHSVVVGATWYAHLNMPN